MKTFFCYFVSDRRRVTKFYLLPFVYDRSKRERENEAHKRRLNEIKRGKSKTLKTQPKIRKQKQIKHSNNHYYSNFNGNNIVKRCKEQDNNRFYKFKSKNENSKTSSIDENSLQLDKENLGKNFLNTNMSILSASDYTIKPSQERKLKGKPSK